MQISIVVPSADSEFGTTTKPSAVAIFYVGNQSLVQGSSISVLVDLNTSSYGAGTTFALVVGLVVVTSGFFYFVAGGFSFGGSSNKSDDDESPKSPKSSSSKKSMNNLFRIDAPKS